jgi:hypothetical protein
VSLGTALVICVVLVLAVYHKGFRKVGLITLVVGLVGFSIYEGISRWNIRKQRQRQWAEERAHKEKLDRKVAILHQTTPQSLPLPCRKPDAIIPKDYAANNHWQVYMYPDYGLDFHQMSNGRWELDFIEDGNGRDVSDEFVDLDRGTITLPCERIAPQ